MTKLTGELESSGELEIKIILQFSGCSCRAEAHIAHTEGNGLYIIFEGFLTTFNIF